MKHFKKIIYFICIFSFVLISGKEILNAQIYTPNLEDQVSVGISSDSPEPFQNITLTAETFSFDINRSKLSWYVNGILKNEGIGMRTFSFQVGDIGQKTSVKLNIQKPTGETISRTYSFIPANVDLVYEADTYTPPFFKGKALYTRESGLKVVAYPEISSASGKIVDPNSLIYTWKLNSSVDAAQSGYGKRVFFHQAKVVERPSTVYLTVEDPVSGSSAFKSIDLEPRDAEVYVYEDNPLLGMIYENAILGSFLLPREETAFSAVPYFFNNKEVSQNSTKYDWKMGGKTISLDRTISLGNTSDQSGVSSISLSVTNGTLLQGGSSAFEILFGSNE